MRPRQVVEPVSFGRRVLRVNAEARASVDIDRRVPHLIQKPTKQPVWFVVAIEINKLQRSQGLGVMAVGVPQRKWQDIICLVNTLRLLVVREIELAVGLRCFVL